MEKAKGSSSGAQTKPAMPKHNMTVVELSTPHMKLPGVQKYTHEDLKLMVEKAKNFPQVHEGFYLAVQNYDFKVDEWELETGNSQPHSDESKLNLRPKTATLTAAERRNEQARKSKEVREQMTKKLDGDRNPTFTRPSTASNPVKQANKSSIDEKTKKKSENIVEKTEEVKSEEEQEEEEEEQKEEEQEQEQEEEVVETKKVKSKLNSNPPRKEKKVELKQEDVYEMDIDESNENKNVEDAEDVNNEELNDSFEKMSVSQHADYLDNSRTSSKQSFGESSSTQKQGAATKQPKKNESKQQVQQQALKAKPRLFKSDVANMMSSMFSEISGFDTDI